MLTATLWHISGLEVLLCLLLPLSLAEALTCSSTLHPSGSASYHLSDPAPSADCETFWEDGNRTVLADDTSRLLERVQALTSQSITLTSCLDRLNYRVDCPPLGVGWEDVECRANCSPRRDQRADPIGEAQLSGSSVNSTLSLASWYREGWELALMVSVPTGVLILALLGFFLWTHISKRRRGSVPTYSFTGSYSAVGDQMKTEPGDAAGIKV